MKERFFHTLDFDGKIAIVVPVGPPHERFMRCLESCRALEDANFVTVVVSDEPIKIAAKFDALNVVTGSKAMTGPAVKRDLAFLNVRADLYAFLDDDAYVGADWLQRVRRVVGANPEVAAFGGPGLMPDDQTLSEQISAATMESFLGGGPLNYRFRKLPKRYCDDFPAFNLCVRAEWLEKIGGWGSSLYGGEDTLLCAKLHRAGAIILYDPMLYIWHYRRALIPKHCWQIYNIGRSRACFIREGEKTSLKGVFFAPLIFSAFLFTLIIAASVPSKYQRISAACLALAFFAVVAFDGGDKQRFKVRIAIPVGIAAQHIAYSYGLLVGFFSGKRNMIPGGSRPRYPRES